MARLSDGDRDILAEHERDATPTTAELVADLKDAVEAVEAERDRLREALARMVAMYESEWEGPFLRPKWLREALAHSAPEPAPSPTERVCRCCVGTGGMGRICSSFRQALDADWCFDCGHDRACHEGAK